MFHAISRWRVARDRGLRAGAAREHAVASALDHLHTEATALAGVASKAPGGSDAPSRVTRSRVARRGRRAGVPAARFGALAVVTTALLVAGGAATSAPSLENEPAAGNSTGPEVVTAFGAAPRVGPDANPPASAPLVDITATPSGDGYWVAAADGGVFTYGRAPFAGSTSGSALNAPIVGITSTPSGAGYWVAAADGGVFAYGDAPFLGSMGGTALASPIFGIASTPTGNGYWLVASDGGVFSFGDAEFFGAATGIASPMIIGLTPSASGAGYYLLATDGGVFSFGDAEFHGSTPNRGGAPATDIAATETGYWVTRADGTIDAYGIVDLGDVTTNRDGKTRPLIGIAAHTGGGFWALQGDELPPPPSPRPDLSQHPFLVCTRRIESGGRYDAVSSSGRYRGAYQFDRGTWNSTAQRAGRPDLVGVDPATVAPADQDEMALNLYSARGAQPWGGRCAGL
jgi:hypothetical protein